MGTKENEKKKALEFYKKYKDALDIIYKWADNEGLLNRPTYLQWIQEVLEELERKKIVKYKPDLRNVDISFFTKQLDDYFQPAPKDKEWGAWRKGVAYFYWFHRINDGADYEIVFELGGINKKNKNDKLNNNKKLLKKIKNAFNKIKSTYMKGKLHPKKGINKKEMGQFNQMYSYRIKEFNSMNVVEFKEEVENGIKSMIEFQNKWLKNGNK